jgi:hypothetical protein
MSISIKKVRQRCFDSLFYLAKNVLEFYDLRDDLHKEMADLIQDHDVKRKLILVPRGHYKSSLASIAYPLWLIIRNPNIRILLSSSTATNAVHFLRRIQKVFERNTLFQELFPHVIPDFENLKGFKWSNTEILIPRDNDYPEATIETMGVGGAVVSRHYDVLIKDDLVNDKIAESEIEMQRCIDWHEYSESLFIVPEAGIDLIMGTRWSMSDLYSYIEQTDKRYKVYVRSAIENNQPIFPYDKETKKGFRKEFLDYLQMSRPFKFALQYMNDPISSDVTDFRNDWLRYYEEKNGTLYVDGEKVTELTNYITVDPAITEGKRSSRSAIIVSSVDRGKNIYIRQAWAARVEPTTLIDQIIQFSLMYQPKVVGIEKVAFQSSIRYWLADRCREERRTIPLIDLEPKNRNKDDRILALEPYFRKGKIFIKEDMTEFRQEYLSFSSGKIKVGKSKDILDALAYGLDLWKERHEIDIDAWAEAFRQRRLTACQTTGY